MLPVKVLIVEDEKLIRWSLRERLEKEGYDIDEAESGGEALSRLDGGEYDLILLDYRLPDMNGLRVLEEIARAESDSLVIMMTAYSTVNNAVEAMRLGAYDYINKPFNMDELVMTIEKAT